MKTIEPKAPLQAADAAMNDKFVMYEHLHVPVFVLQTDACQHPASICCVYANAAMRSLLGYDGQEIRGMGCDFLKLVVHDNHRDFILKAVSKLTTDYHLCEYGNDVKVLPKMKEAKPKTGKPKNTKKKRKTVEMPREEVWLKFSVAVCDWHDAHKPKEFLFICLELGSNMPDHEQTRERQIERNRRANKARLVKLNARDLEVLKLFVKGYPYREIGIMLKISDNAVEKRISKIIVKLDLLNSSELMKFVFCNGLE
jgi:DNA-binding CsgD family transcriptional regulator